VKSLVGFMLEQDVVDLLDAIRQLHYGCPRSAVLRKALENWFLKERPEEWAKVLAHVEAVRRARLAAHEQFLEDLTRRRESRSPRPTAGRHVKDPPGVATVIPLLRQRIPLA
jgi:hypothetical protein